MRPAAMSRRMRRCGFGRSTPGAPPSLFLTRPRRGARATRAPRGRNPLRRGLQRKILFPGADLDAGRVIGGGSFGRRLRQSARGSSCGDQPRSWSSPRIFPRLKPRLESKRDRDDALEDDAVLVSAKLDLKAPIAQGRRMVSVGLSRQNLIVPVDEIEIESPVLLVPASKEAGIRGLLIRRKTPRTLWWPVAPTSC